MSRLLIVVGQGFRSAVAPWIPRAAVLRRCRRQSASGHPQRRKWSCRRFFPEYGIQGDDLHAVAYRPVRESAKGTGPVTEHIHVWPAPLAVGQELPLLPLGLDRGLCVPLDLEATYTEACRRGRLG